MKLSHSEIVGNIVGDGVGGVFGASVGGREFNRKLIEIEKDEVENEFPIEESPKLNEMLSPSRGSLIAENSSFRNEGALVGGFTRVHVMLMSN